MPQQPSTVDAAHTIGARTRPTGSLVVLEVEPDRRDVVFRELAALQGKGARVVVFEEPPR